jgi:pimeloyl-ACP methyl ester carboxylesterase
MLNVLSFGDHAGIPVLIVHGLFGSGRNWGVIARRLAEMRPVIAVDMRNHGDSPRFATQGYADMAGDLAQVIAAHGGRADVLGHSMGGKAAMVLALTHPDRVRRLIVADIAPVAYGHSQSHHIAAMRALDLTGLRARSEADRRLAETVQDAALRAFFLQSLDLKSDPPRWKLNLDVLEAEMPKIVGWPEITGRYDGPALFLSGALSDYVRPEHRATISALFPRVRLARIPGAGHWLHADKPREFEAAVQTWLDATEAEVTS